MELLHNTNRCPRISFLAALAIFTGLLGGFPFLVYGWQKAAGLIPAHWERPELGGNPPWAYHWMGIFMFFSFVMLLMLPIATVIAATILFIRQRRAAIIFQGIALMIAQWGMAIAHLSFALYMME